MIALLGGGLGGFALLLVLWAVAWRAGIGAMALLAVGLGFAAVAWIGFAVGDDGVWVIPGFLAMGFLGWALLRIDDRVHDDSRQQRAFAERYPSRPWRTHR